MVFALPKGRVNHVCTYALQDYPIGWPLLPPSRSKKIEQLVHRVCNSPVAWRIICEGSLKNTKEHAIFELRVLETPKGNLFNLKHFLEAQRKTWNEILLWRFNWAITWNVWKINSFYGKSTRRATSIPSDSNPEDDDSISELSVEWQRATTLGSGHLPVERHVFWKRWKVASSKMAVCCLKSTLFCSFLMPWWYWWYFGYFYVWEMFHNSLVSDMGLPGLNWPLPAGFQAWIAIGFQCVFLSKSFSQMVGWWFRLHWHWHIRGPNPPKGMSGCVMKNVSMRRSLAEIEMLSTKVFLNLLILFAVFFCYNSSCSMKWFWDAKAHMLCRTCQDLHPVWHQDAHSSQKVSICLKAGRENIAEMLQNSQTIPVMNPVAW